jgi:hypothetical protein
MYGLQSILFDRRINTFIGHVLQKLQRFRLKCRTKCVFTVLTVCALTAAVLPYSNTLVQQVRDYFQLNFYYDVTRITSRIEHDVRIRLVRQIFPSNLILSVFICHSTDNVTRETLWKNLIFQRYNFFFFMYKRDCGISVTMLVITKLNVA